MAPKADLVNNKTIAISGSSVAKQERDGRPNVARQHSLESEKRAINKGRLMINTTWDGSEVKDLNKNSRSRLNRSLQHGADEESKLHNQGEEQAKPLTNIKSMIKHLLNNGDKTEITESRQSSTKSNGVQRPPFFKQGGPIKVKQPSPQGGLFSSTPAGHSLLRQTTSPKSQIYPIKPAHPSNNNI